MVLAVVLVAVEQVDMGVDAIVVQRVLGVV